MKENSIYRWVKASENKLPPLSKDVIIKDGENVYKDRTDVGWDKRVTDYYFLEEIPVTDQQDEMWRGIENETLMMPYGSEVIEYLKEKYYLIKK